MSQLLPSRRWLLACLTLCFAVLHPSASAAETWREIESPHFRVVTYGSEGDGRNVAKEFEQMRSVFAVRFNNAAIDVGAPLLVLAVREPGLHALAPGFWKQRDRIAGEFFSGWERQYALIRLDSFGDLNQAVVFHEYAHSIFHANLHWLPGWLDEGMAEFYAYTRFEGDRIYVGAPSVRFSSLQNEPLIPISEMLKSNGHTFEKDPRRNNLFYGEAWIMIHYMTFGPNMGGGAKLNQFISFLQDGTSQERAFQQVFGDTKAFEQTLSAYRTRFTMAAARMPPGPVVDAKSFTVKILTPAETDYSLGSLDLAAHDPVEARKRLQAAESADPSLAGPREELGFLDWREGHDDEARAEWQKAVSADPFSVRSAFALLMSSIRLNQEDQHQLEDTRNALEALKQKAPRYAPVLIELALVEWRLGHLNQAYQNSLAAEKLQPWRAGYHLLSGYILLQDHQPKLAEDYARMVAARWPGADHDEAVDLWNLMPASIHGDGPALAYSPPTDSSVVRGIIVSSSCDNSAVNLVIQPDTLHAPVLKLVATGRWESGFSDTLWMGEDHYTPCFHLSGRPAVVIYRGNGAATGTLLELEVRDDLPDVHSPALAFKATWPTNPSSSPP